MSLKRQNDTILSDLTVIVNQYEDFFVNLHFRIDTTKTKRDNETFIT